MLNLKKIALFALAWIFLIPAFAENIVLNVGQSQVIRTPQRIDTIFVSSPNVADYEVIDDYSYVVYAKSEGTSTITAFDKSGKAITEDKISVVHSPEIVNALIDDKALAKAQFPKSDIQVKQVGKTFILEGKVNSAYEHDLATRIIGAGSGSPVSKEQVKGKNGPIDFLTKYNYDNVIDNTTTALADQINIKLTVVEVDKHFMDELGFNGFGVTPNNTSTKGHVGLDLAATSSARNVFTFSNGKFNLAFQALNDQGNVKILTQPNISILSGEMGSIFIGGEFPYSSSSKDGISTSYKEFGIHLKVGAKIEKDDRIRVYLEQEVSNIKPGSLALSISRSSSIFELYDGQGFVIGGLYNSADIESLSKVPLLGDIPILGAFFRNASSSKETKELMVVATVNLVKPVDPSQVVYPTFESTGTLERFLNLGFIKTLRQKVEARNFLGKGGFIQ